MLVDLIKKRGVQPDSNTSLWACFSRFVNHRDGRPIHHDTLATNIGFFFLAGYDSTAHTITWALLELASDAQLQVWSYFIDVIYGNTVCLER